MQPRAPSSPHPPPRGAVRCADRAEHGPLPAEQGRRLDVPRLLIFLVIQRLVVKRHQRAVAPTSAGGETEEIGGVRNWDYRYCWLRDASLTVRALMDIGFDGEAGAFVGWLLHATHRTWPRLQVVYDVFGNANLEEQELEHLSGYRGSQPVRTGNGAVGQLQLDVYGEVIAATHEYIMRGGRVPSRRLQGLRQLGDRVARVWNEPDAGLGNAYRAASPRALEGAVLARPRCTSRDG